MCSSHGARGKMIKIDNLSFRYEDETDPEKFALIDIDLDINEGEFVALIGENGSGKSTLAKIINAVLKPTSGKVYVDEMNVEDEENLWKVRATAGMVFQNPDNQMVASVVEEDVAFGPENLGVEPALIRKRVDDALATVGMSKMAKRAPNQLSGGQKQRVAIAGVLAMQPKCIIFDESTAMLDPSGRKEVMESIRKLVSTGMTIVLVTHHMDEAVQADRVVVICEGKIKMDGNPHEIFSKPDILKESGLDLPQITEIAQNLRRGGLNVSYALSVEELADQIMVLSSAGVGGVHAD